MRRVTEIQRFDGIKPQPLKQTSVPTHTGVLFFMKIHKHLLEWCARSSSDVVIPNYYVGRFEMDVFKLAASGFITEYEVKISKGDFKIDFLKSYTNHLHERIFKHDLIKAGKRCNRFYFVVPSEIIDIKIDVPVYCGMISYDNQYHRFHLVKNAPLLSRNIADNKIYIDLARSLSFRERNLRNKLEWELRKKEHNGR